MNKLVRLVAPALVATIGLGAATSASAWEAPRHHENVRYGNDRATPARNAQVRAEINGLRAQIDRAAARRTISSREAAGLRRDATQIQRLYAGYARNGLTAQEVRVLKSRVDRVQIALRAERGDHDGRRG